ncbi:hypothetical protein MIDIC_240038 [Alphaproteobacteria bacterium]
MYSLKKAQSLLIPIICGSKNKEVAKILCVSESCIHQMRSRQAKELNDPSCIKPFGGRRRFNMNLDEEKELLKMLEKSTAIGEHIDSHTIKQKYEEKLGRTVHISTITRLLARHGWTKLISP